MHTVNKQICTLVPSIGYPELPGYPRPSESITARRRTFLSVLVCRGENGGDLNQATALVGPPGRQLHHRVLHKLPSFWKLLHKLFGRLEVAFSNPYCRVTFQDESVRTFKTSEEKKKVPISLY